MSEIASATKSGFFPNSTNNKTSKAKANALRSKLLQRNNTGRAQELKSTTSNDARVNISDSIKDFARIKRSVDASAPIDNSKKIAALKASIQNGTYKVDYDALADKMLKTEF